MKNKRRQEELGSDLILGAPEPPRSRKGKEGREHKKCQERSDYQRNNEK